MRHVTAISLSLGLLFSAGAITQVTAQSDPVEVVDYVDVDRYMGLWYEIAAFPTLFEAGCTGVTATYGLNDDGTVAVTNDCAMFWLNGPQRSAEGYAEVVDPDTNAKLKVYFGNAPVGGDYWIIDLDEEGYQWAVVGDPTRSYLWILARNPQIPDRLYDELKASAEAQGFDTDQLVEMRQPRR